MPRNGKWGVVLSVGFAALSLGTCSLKSYPPHVLLTVKPTPGRARALSDRKCFGVFITNNGGETSSAEVGTRSPACFGIAGRFAGAFTYAELAGGAVSVPLALGSHSVYLLALDKTTECSGKELTYFFPDSTDASDAYAVGTSGEIEITTDTTEISVPATLYGEPPTNLTPLCPRSGTGCTGSLFCDTFTGSEGSALSTHIPDVGVSGWQIVGADNPVITGERANVTAESHSEAYFSTDVGNMDISVSTTIWMAPGAFNARNYYLFGRYSDGMNFTFGVIYRGNSGCRTTLVQKVSGVDSVKATSEVFPCNPDVPYEMRLVLKGDKLEFTFNGLTISYNQPGPPASGSRAGIYVETQAPSNSTYIDDFIVRQL